MNLEITSYRTSQEGCKSFGRFFPSLYFYWNLVKTVIISGNKAQKNKYHDQEWVESSRQLLHYLENSGVSITVTGLEHLQQLQQPCLIIGNHMSLLETVLLPGFIQPIRPVTFVIKQSLLEYPVFQHVMRSRNPIAVSRTNPREDLKTVLTEGARRLQEGISVIIFPQTTRSHTFDPAQMSTIGVKLARSVNAPVVPLALKTDAMQNGSVLKDFGRIDPAKKVFFAFAPPISVAGKGHEEQGMINAFISEKLKEWQQLPGIVA